MLGWIGGLFGDGHDPILRSIDDQAGQEVRSVSVPPLAQVSARTEDSPPEVHSVSFHTVHLLSMLRPTVFLSMPPPHVPQFPQ